ncbi:MAG TPA: hypothetical protein VGX28_06550 [Frankiaceae bacterium]|jgi:hypothetical protein|nr:hypothetical protein [Frankiaceae bacterium]
MSQTRALSLRRETLAALTSDELTVVAGGSHLCAATDRCTHASIDASCPTVPLADCLSLKGCIQTR